MRVEVRPDRSKWGQLLQRPTFSNEALEDIVKPVLKAIQDSGDKALLEYTAKFDGVVLDSLLVSSKELSEAANIVSEELKQAIQVAKRNIEKFHDQQHLAVEKIETSPGVVCWREQRAIESVGLYIPGGTAPLFSTILMLVIPAKLAGCKEIVLCTPPNKEGKVHPAILYTAHLLGVTTLVKAGGAQAIAAMAYGTETVPKVFKIFGPGNQYVTAAKQLVTKDGTAIDMPAGPSEVAVVADANSNAVFVASDLLSQAEHGVDSQVVLFSDTEGKVREVNVEIERQLALLPRGEMAAKSLENSLSIVVDSTDDIIDLINIYGPEHLILQNQDYRDYIPKIMNAGSVFLGPYTPESAGDYASGTNHTLPTNGYAKAYSGVSLESFTKRITFQEITKEGLSELGPHIEVMAAEEQLDAHKNAVTFRLNS